MKTPQPRWEECARGEHEWGAVAEGVRCRWCRVLLTGADADAIWQGAREGAAACQHCGYLPDPLVTRSVVVDQPGHPVSAVCTLTHCQHFEGAAALRTLIADLVKALKWTDEKLSKFVTEDTGNGAFVRGTSTELAGFGLPRAEMRDVTAKAESPLSGEAKKEEQK